MRPEFFSVDSVYPIQSGSRPQFPNKRRVNEILTVKESDCKPAMNTMRQKIIRPAPSEISYKEMRFLITDRPTDQTITNFIEVCLSHVSTKCILHRNNVILVVLKRNLHSTEMIKSDCIKSYIFFTCRDRSSQGMWYREMLVGKESRVYCTYQRDLKIIMKMNFLPPQYWCFNILCVI